MHYHQEIIETYCRSDFEQRLSLYLSYPSLRNTFIRIDQGEYERKQALQRNSTRVKAGCNRIISWALGLQKFL